MPGVIESKRRLIFIEPKAVTQNQVYEAGVLFARTEGIVPAPETNHALATIIDAANQAKEEGKEKVIIVNLSGHGLLDLSSYDRYFADDLVDLTLSEEDILESEKVFEGFPKPEQLKSL